MPSPCQSVTGSRDRADPQTKSSQRSPDIVLKVDELTLQKPAIGQQQMQPLGLRALDLHRSEPAQPHHIGDATDIAAACLVGLSFNESSHVACVSDCEFGLARAV